MFIRVKKSGYTSHGEQFAHGPFLILMQPDIPWTPENGFYQGPLRAIVRHARLRQLGHWMMGSCVVHGERIALSGSYGSDGLPRVVPQHIFDLGIELPAELYAAWNKGGGWNSAGSEESAMRTWAKKHVEGKA